MTRSGPPSVVLLTGNDLEHQYVARTLGRTGLVTTILVVQPSPVSARDRLRRAIRRFGVLGTASRVFVRLLLTVTGERRRRVREKAQILGRDGFPQDVALFTVTGVNSPATRSLLADLGPDYLLIYGTSVVSDATLSTARVMALNMHTGISPRYRGADCAFWPLVHAEPEWLGATVHECTSDLDGGAIYATRRARFRGDEGVGGVFARCVEAGAEAYAEAVTDLVAARAAATPQDLTSGREYRASMRGPVAELRAVLALRRGLLKRLP